MVELGYNSVRFIYIKNAKLAIIHLTLQIGILLYVILYTVIIQKSYQLYERVEGVTSVKLKGTASGNITNDNSINAQFFDVYDLQNPPTEADAFFVATTMVPTHQQRGDCAGVGKDYVCASDGDCVAGTYTNDGIISGKCQLVNGTKGGQCMLHSWCPLEDESKTSIVMKHVDTWTAFAKVNVVFPRYQIVRTNSEDTDTAPRPGSNLFSLRQLVENAGSKFEDVVARGAIILVQVNYDCDLNHDASECNPTYSFSRIDSGRLSPGFNYRYALHAFAPGQPESRVLYKVYGVRVLFRVSGQGGKFNIVPLMTSLGAGMALLSVATVVCDLLMTYVLPDRDKYLEAKNLPIGEEEALQHSLRHKPPAGRTGDVETAAKYQAM